MSGKTDRNRVAQSGIQDFDRKSDIRDMVSGALTFAAEVRFGPART